MSTTLDEQIKQLKQAIAEIEAQRSILGDAAVDASLAPFHQKFAELEAQTEPIKETQSEIPTRQRKLVTLLYIDVVGSTAMTQHLDPEHTLEILGDTLPRKVGMSPETLAMASKLSLAIGWMPGCPIAAQMRSG